LTDSGIRWSSRRLRGPGASISAGGLQNPTENPACIVTTDVRDAQSGGIIVWLRRDERLLRFYQGKTDRLDVLPNLPSEVESEGIAVDEARIVGSAWTNGHAVILVPNNPTKPVKRLSLTVSPERLHADIHVSVVVNGSRVLDDIARRTSDWAEWTRTVELPDFGSETSLRIEIESDTFILPGDARILGVRLNRLSLER
jgi:hypothetical protein